MSDADAREPTFLGFPSSRRSMLRTSVLAAGAALIGCTPGDQHASGSGDTLAPDRGPVPPDLDHAEDYIFLGDEEAVTLEAIVARIIPGSADDPGALEAGVPFYIDRKLDSFEEFAEPTYQRGPFAEGFDEGETPPGGADTVAVPAAELYRYGFQSELAPRELYRTGLAAVDRLAQTRRGYLFADLDEESQDDLLMVLEGVQQRSEGEETGPSDAQLDQAEDLFGDTDPGAFFDTVRTDTIEGMFSDPEYGGNRNLVGWSLVGWPGAQRSYSPREMMHGTDKQPTSMNGLTPMNPDRAGGGRPALEQPKRGVHNH